MEPSNKLKAVTYRYAETVVRSFLGRAFDDYDRALRQLCLIRHSDGRKLGFRMGVL